VHDAAVTLCFRTDGSFAVTWYFTDMRITETICGTDSYGQTGTDTRPLLYTLTAVDAVSIIMLPRLKFYEYNEISIYTNSSSEVVLDNHHVK